MVRSVLAVLVCLTLVTACGRREKDTDPAPDAGPGLVDAGSLPDAGEPDAPDAGPELLTLDGFCTGLVRALSESEAACLGGPAEGWEGELVELCPGLKKAVGAGLLGYRAEAAQSCLNAVAANPCLDEASFDLHASPACLQVLTGLVATGSACETDLVCGSGHYCAFENWTCPGTCQPFIPLDASCNREDPETACGPDAYCGGDTCQPLVAAGAPCPEQWRGCPRGTTCSGAEGEEICAPRQPSGECWYDDACVPGHTCVGTNWWEELPGACTPLARLGETCDFEDDVCEPFTYCDAVTETCTRFGTAALKSPCGSLNGSFVDCIGGYCRFDPESDEGTCVDFLAPGSECQFDHNECGPGGNCEYRDEEPSICVSNCGRRQLE